MYRRQKSLLLGVAPLFLALCHGWSAPSSVSSKRSSDTPPNQLWPVASLRNDYFALRHGQSKANVAGVIASNPLIACTKYGLSQVGQQQADQAGHDVVAAYHDIDNNDVPSYQGLLLLSSDLLRAKETAEATRTVVLQNDIPLITEEVIMETRLRERWFGDWDEGCDQHYEDVWKDDAIDPTHETNQVESVHSVMRRVTECILEWDANVEGHMIVCVAHGDVLQILQTCFRKLEGSKHRTLDHLETATLRKLDLKVLKEE